MKANSNVHERVKGRKKAAKVSLWAVVTIPFALILLVSATLIGILGIQSGTQAAHDLAAQQQTISATRVNQYLDSYLATPNLINELNLDSIRLNELNLSDSSAVELHFLAQMQRFPTIKSIAFASEEAVYFGITRQSNEEAEFNFSESSENTGFAFVSYETNRQGEHRNLTSSYPDYDPRLRPWYQSAVEAGQATWTPIFVWINGSNVGLDMVTPVYAENGDLFGVLDVSLVLTGINDFLQNAPVTKNGSIFIVDEAGLLVASSTSQNTFSVTNNSVDRLNAQDVDEPVIKAAAQRVIAQSGDWATVENSQQLRFDSLGERYLMSVTPYQNSGLHWWVVVVTPESDFLATINNRFRQTVLLIVLALALSIAVTSQLAHRISRPILQLNQASKEIAAGNWSASVPVSNQTELGELALSFNHMAEQLHKSTFSLQSSEARLRAIFDNSVDAIAVSDKNGFVTFNPAFVEMFGYSTSDAGIQVLDAIAPSERARVGDYIRWRSEGQSVPEMYETRGRRQDGSEFDMEVLVTTYIQDSELYSLALLRDITERKQAAEKLKASEAQLSNAQRIAQMGSWYWDARTNTKVWSDELYRITGLDRALPALAHEELGKLYTPESFVLLNNAVTKAWDNSEPYDLELEIIRRDGVHRKVHALGSTVQDDYGAVIALQGTLQDITERKQAEETVQISEQTAHRMADSLRMVNEIGIKITSGLDLDRLLQALYEECQRIGETDHFYVSLYDDVTEILSFPLDYENGKRSPIPSRRNHTVSGLTEYILEHRQTLHIPNTFDLPQTSPFMRKPDDPTRSYIGVPLMIKDRVIGVLSMQSNEPNAYSLEQIRTLELLATPAAIAIQNSQLHEQAQQEIAERKQAEKDLQKQLNELETLYENGLIIGQLLSQREVGQKTIELLEQKMDWHHIVIRLLNPKNEKLELLAFTGYHDNSGKDAEGIENHLNSVISGLEDGLTGWSIKKSKTLNLSNLHADPRYKELTPGMQSGLYVPMIANQQKVGVISIESENLNAFTDSHERLVTTLANQAAVALENARLFQMAAAELVERKRFEALLEEERNQLAQRVEERTSDLSRSNADLARALRVKDEFLASMSHELRTPLTGILGLSEAMQLKAFGELSEKQRKTLKNIEESGRHLLDLINDILDLSKIEAGMLGLHFEPCSLTDICLASLQLTKGMAQHKKQQIQYLPPTEPVIILADARHLKQILVNLLSNAIKFSPEKGDLGLDVQINKAEQNIKLTVWDKGIGIKPENMDKLFKPFTQIDSSLAREYSGTGLGLSLVYRLAELHHGGIEVESVFGEGSRFTVTLPWSPPGEIPQLPLQHKLISEKSPAATLPKSVIPSTILIADDNEGVLEMFADYLEFKKYHVIKTRSGAELLERSAEIHPSVILVDIQMPGMDGLETIRRLRSHTDPIVALTPVIAVTALAMRGDREKCMEAGANEYLSKPVRMADLATVIRNLIEKKQ